MKERINEVLVFVYWATLFYSATEIVLNGFQFSNNKYIRNLHKLLLFIFITHMSIKLFNYLELYKYINIYCMGDKATPGIDEIKEVNSGINKSKLGVNEGTIHIVNNTNNNTNNNYNMEKAAMFGIFMNTTSKAIQRSGLTPIAKLGALTGAGLGALGMLSMTKKEKSEEIIKKVVFKKTENSGKEENIINVDEELISQLEIIIEGMMLVKIGILMQMQFVFYSYIWDKILTEENIKRLPIINEKIKINIINISKKRKKISIYWYIFIYMSIFITTSYSLYHDYEILGNMGYYIDNYLRTYDLYNK